MHMSASVLQRLNRIHETEARSPGARIERVAKEEEEEEGRDKVNAARINLPHAVCKTYLRMRCATGNVQRCTDTPIRTVDICGGHFNTPPLQLFFFVPAHLLAD